MAVLNGSNFSFYSGELDWSVVLQKTPRYYNSQKPTNSDYALYAWCRVHSGYNTPLRVFQARKNMAHYLDNTGTPLIYSSEYVDSFFTISNYAEFENAIAKYVLSIDFTQNSQVTFSTQGKWEDADAIGGNPGILHYLATGGFRYAFSGIAEQKSNFIYVKYYIYFHDYYQYNDINAWAGLGLVDNDWRRLAVVGLAQPYNIIGRSTLKSFKITVVKE